MHYKLKSVSKSPVLLTKQSTMNNFSESERRCQAAFLSCPEVYHAYTSGKDMPIVFTTTADLAFVMNAISYAAFTLYDKVKIIAFAVMNNHFHFVIAGARDDIESFFQCLIRKVRKIIPEAGRMKLSLKEITDLTSMRNNIAYTNRNGFVANPEHTPFSYPWSTGRYYFNDIVARQSYGEVSFAQKREMFKGRVMKFPDNWPVIDGYVSPEAFCPIKFGMSLFRNAHQYFSFISKSIEAYSGIAVDIDDSEFLTDPEMFTQLLKIIRERYRLNSLRDLSKAQKLDVARLLHFDYRSSNGQIRRLLGLSEYEIDSLFARNNQ